MIIHGLVLLMALIIGVKNLAIGFERSRRWTFPIFQHKKLGIWFVALTILGIILGYIGKTTFKNPKREFLLPGHKTIFVFIAIFLILLIVSSLLRTRRYHRFRWFQKLHEWFAFILLVLYFAQFFTAAGRLLKLL
ncbi:MAG: hypothetical protein NZ601_04000 [candidate division WOR-3 bacterium]|nr:hypothetical protein [candidate division WOR-3 bacterium]